MCRLVADQNTTAVLESLERHISAHTPRHARISFRPIAAQGRLVTEPYRMPKDTLGNQAAAKVLLPFNLGENVLFHHVILGSHGVDQNAEQGVQYV